MKFSTASIAAATLMMVGVANAQQSNLDVLRNRIMMLAQENISEMQNTGAIASGTSTGTGAVQDMITQIIANMDSRTVASLVDDSLPKNALGGSGRRLPDAPDGEFCFDDSSPSPPSHGGGKGGKKGGGNGGKKGGHGGKKGAEEETGGFSLFIQLGPLGDAVSDWEGGPGFGAADPGESASLGAIMFGLQITFDSDIEPFVPSETDPIDFFIELFLSISQVDFTIGVLSGTATKNRSFLLQSAYLNYGLDYLVIPIFGDCSPIVGLGQIRAAGTVLGLGGIGDLGLTPITAASFDNCGSANGGEILFGTDESADGGALVIGFLPFSDASSCNFNGQLEALVEFFTAPFTGTMAIPGLM